MVNCPKCGAAVKEEKAFCQNCGSPMDAAMRQRETPLPDFSATIIEPPRRVASQPFVPPVVTEVQPTGRETAPVQQHVQQHVQQQQQYPPAGAAVPLPTPALAPPPGKRKSSRKIGFAFVILLLFLMFAVFVLALLID
ncbi:MAG TPA: zinc ribbon domain-containing protein [Pyrinomonadaceae bacterium]|nr:zinc ribbon domain-containing protein [Pyrinomonadaceae bacterium]